MPAAPGGATHGRCPAPQPVRPDLAAPGCSTGSTHTSHRVSGARRLQCLQRAARHLQPARPPLLHPPPGRFGDGGNELLPAGQLGHTLKIHYLGVIANPIARWRALGRWRSGCRDPGVASTRAAWLPVRSRGSASRLSWKFARFSVRVSLTQKCIWRGYPGGWGSRRTLAAPSGSASPDAPSLAVNQSAPETARSSGHRSRLSGRREDEAGSDAPISQPERRQVRGDRACC